MHIEEGIVEGSKMLLSYGTAAAVFALAAKQSFDHMREQGIIAFFLRALLATGLVFTFFELMPHYPVGVSEVHFILGSTLYLLFGAAPAAIGLAAGLLIQGVFFAPFDLPQYGINVTTLLVPLFAVAYLARKIIPANTAYKDVTYGQALKLSTTYQAGVVAWVAFWALYGQGFGAENLNNVLTFGGAYMLVIIVEPLADLAVLAACKFLSGLEKTPLVQRRVYNSAGSAPAAPVA